VGWEEKGRGCWVLLCLEGNKGKGGGGMEEGVTGWRWAEGLLVGDLLPG